MYIFMDESWDLGSHSKYFVISFLLVHNKKPIDKMVIKMLNYKKIKRYKIKDWVLHFTKELPSTRKKLLTLLNLYDEVKIVTMVLKKEELPSNRRDDVHKIYEEVVKKLLIQIFESDMVPFAEPIVFIASRRETNKHLNNLFIYSIEEVSKIYKVDMKIQIQAPYNDKWLQIVDFICWSIFKKYENDEKEYYDIISDLITIEKPYTQRNTTEIVRGNHTDADV